MMRRHASVLAPFALIPSALILCLALFVAACGSSSNDADSAAPDVPAATSPVAAAATLAPDQVGSLGDAVEVAAGAPGQATDEVCAVERRTLTTASDAFYAINGTDPTSQTDLLDAALIRELTPRFEITPEGVIVPAAGSPCT